MLNHAQNRKHPEAPLQFIFLAQCIDHALALCMAAVIFIGGLSLTNSFNPLSLKSFGPSFWAGLMLVLFVSSLTYRLIFSLLWGSTLGSTFFGLNNKSQNLDTHFWRGHVFESACLAFPMLWAVDIFLRVSQGESLGFRYEFYYSK